jgi:cytochrome c nitrite reductase small subunit
MTPISRMMGWPLLALVALLLVGKYYVKAKKGFWHSFYFTTGRFHERIQITPGNRKVTEKACRKCHAAIDPMPGHRPSDKTSCIRCHSTVGQMR